MQNLSQLKSKHTFVARKNVLNVYENEQTNKSAALNIQIIDPGKILNQIYEMCNSMTDFWKFIMN